MIKVILLLISSDVAISTYVSSHSGSSPRSVADKNKLNSTINSDLRFSILDYTGSKQTTKKKTKRVFNKMDYNNLDYDFDVGGKTIEEAIEDVIILPDLIKNYSQKYGEYPRSQYPPTAPDSYHPVQYGDYNNNNLPMNNGGHRASLLDPLFLMATLSFITFLVNSILGLVDKIRLPIVRARLGSINDLDEIVNFLNQTLIN